jgi:hypothetical protein
LIKVKPVSNFYDDNEMLEFLNRAYIPPLNTSIIFCRDNNFDFLLVFNSTKKKYLKKRTIAITLEPSWSPSIVVNYLNKYCSKIAFHDPDLLNLNLDHVIVTPNIIGHYSQKNLSDILSKKNQKIKNISYIVSSNSGNENYELRHNLINQILQSDLDIDIYGRGHSTILDRRYKGPLTDKMDGLFDYKYSISIENSCEKNYITEKFLDPILCLTVPIYYGAPNIDKVYPSNSFIPLDFSDPINQLANIFKNDTYDVRLEELKLARSIYLNDYNIYNFLERNLSPVEQLSPVEKILSTLYRFIYFK